MIPRNGPRPNAEAWRRQLRDAFRDPAALLEWLGIDPDALRLSARTPFSMLVPEAFARRMARGDMNDPLLRQVLPLADEDRSVPGFGSDPVGDRQSRTARGLLHKYRGRALLVTTGACAIHCRYCFRREFPYASEHVSPAHWDEALDYIGADSSIEEVILSGGDPLMLSTARLTELSNRLAGIAHLRRLRIHTRLPVILPDRIDAALTGWIRSLPWPLVTVIHANHAAEFDHSVDRALGRLKAAGSTLLNQAVLLAGINDDRDRLAALMRRGFEAGALPYYLHLLDRVSGSAHFEVGESMARSLIEQLRRDLSGYLVPRLVREQTGAPYKLPVF